MEKNVQSYAAIKEMRLVTPRLIRRWPGTWGLNLNRKLNLLGILRVQFGETNFFFFFVFLRVNLIEFTPKR